MAGGRCLRGLCRCEQGAGAHGSGRPHPPPPPQHTHAADPQVHEAARQLGYQPDETFCLKVSQMREIFAVRWSVFLLGPAGCGKSAIWRTLMRAQNNFGEKSVSVGVRVRRMGGGGV